jgi:peptide/nickel transport system ATP-binding protein
VQAQVLTLLREIRDTHGTAILFITHDLGIVAELCDRLYVMYAGAILRSVREELLSIPGKIPLAWELPKGCRFVDRCPERLEKCDREPPHFPREGGHSARCWRCEAQP